MLELSGFGAAALARSIRFIALNRLPWIDRDLSCLVSEEMETGSLLEFFRKDPALTDTRITVKDVFRGDKLPAGRKSLTFSIQ
jgi:phenylalanyl-tRNA synthetase beta chain